MPVYLEGRGEGRGGDAGCAVLLRNPAEEAKLHRRSGGSFVEAPPPPPVWQLWGGGHWEEVGGRGSLGRGLRGGE